MSCGGDGGALVYAAQVSMPPDVQDTESTPDPRLQELVEELASRAEGRAESCIELSDISELAQEPELGEEDIQQLQDMLEARGVEVRDDCGRAGVEQTSYVIDNLAAQGATAGVWDHHYAQLDSQGAVTGSILTSRSFGRL